MRKLNASKIVDIISSGSSGNCSLIKLGNTTIMIDCGIPIKKLKSKIVHNIPDLLIITHEHGDHYSIKNIRYLSKLGTDIYMSNEMCEKDTIEYVVPIQFYNKELIKYKDIKILPIKMFHNVPTYGFTLQAKDEYIFWGTDTWKIPYKFKGLTRIFVEANYESEECSFNNYNHMELKNTIKFIKNNLNKNIKEIEFLHISEKYGNNIKQNKNKIIMKILEDYNEKKKSNSTIRQN